MPCRTTPPPISSRDHRRYALCDGYGCNRLRTHQEHVDSVFVHPAAAPHRLSLLLPSTFRPGRYDLLHDTGRGGNRGAHFLRPRCSAGRNHRAVWEKQQPSTSGRAVPHDRNRPAGVAGRRRHPTGVSARGPPADLRPTVPFKHDAAAHPVRDAAGSKGCSSYLAIDAAPRRLQLDGSGITDPSHSYPVDHVHDATPDAAPHAAGDSTNRYGCIHDWTPHTHKHLAD